VCTLAIYYRVDDEYPLVVAANRDELLARPASGPAALSRDPWVVGGKDLTAGGTWLGVNQHHLVAGLLNRRSTSPPDPSKRSRGLLCLEVLRQRTPGEALEALRAYPADAFNSFNLLIASPETALVVSNSSGDFEPTTLTPGLHLLTNLALNDVTCPRIAKSYALFEAALGVLQGRGLREFRGELRAVLSDHSTPLDPRGGSMPNNLCVHGETYGTRSSSLLVYSASAGVFRLWHANGPPCQTPYAEIALPLK
jgi:uncharacterized protein with NRDE domain